MLKKYVLFFILFAFLVFGVFLTIQTATSGAEIAKLESEEERLKEQNQTYKEDILDKSSLKITGEKAGELGFIKPLQIVYLTEEETVAKLP